MFSIDISKVTHIVTFDRQVDIHFGASIITVTGSNRFMDPLVERITEFRGDSDSWLRLDDENYTSVNVYHLGSVEPHYK